jgi:hypothetical protein
MLFRYTEGPEGLVLASVRLDYIFILHESHFCSYQNSREFTSLK